MRTVAVGEAGPEPAPLFSVLIPSYNRPRQLVDAVSSVLASRLADVEVLISDDMSPRQPEIRDRLAPLLADRRVRYIEQRVNLREPANRAFLASASRGQWLLYLGDDDRLEPEALDRLAGAIKGSPTADVFAFGYRLIDGRGLTRYSRRAPRQFSFSLESGAVFAEFMYSDAFPFWFYHPASFCARRSVMERVVPNNEIGMGDDLLFLFDYVNTGGTVVVIPEVLMSYRKGSELEDTGAPNQSAADLANVVTRFKILQSLVLRSDLSPPMRAIVHADAFRDRFLFQAIINEDRDPLHIAKQIGMPPDDLNALALWAARRGRRVYRAIGFLRRVSVYVSMFGLLGILELVRTAGLRLVNARSR
ncbi:MAG: glycosyltransferase family 2 protein [Gemmatimonadetes bacterium]|nr:glycosyltransferase family 2 protein [Gemmatimonadota bacterium]